MKRVIAAILIVLASSVATVAAEGEAIPHGQVVVKGKPIQQPRKMSGNGPVIPSQQVVHNAPLVVEESNVPVLMPFRMWVAPVWSGGITTSGHYEYFQLQMGQQSQMVLSAPGLEPVIAPIVPQQGDPATPPR